MKMSMYSLKDELMDYTPPIPFAKDEIALRWYKEMQTENITIRTSKDQFSLWKLGEFDSETGEMTNDKYMIAQGDYINEK